MASASLAALLLGPLLGPGFPLRYDLVSVPRPVLDADALGLGDRLPRAVPLDAAVAVAARILPDAWLTQLMALTALSLAGWGASRLAGPSRVARAVALVVAVWNPFVGEQLGIGHVPHLLAYGCLPWVALHAHSVVRRRPGALAALVVVTALGSLTPGGGVLCVVVAVAVAAAATAVASSRPPATEEARPRCPQAPWGPEESRRTSSVALAVTVVCVVGFLQLPWIVAGSTHPALGTGGSAAADFRVRAETPLGPVVDALGLGGMWNAQSLPDGRSGAAALASTVVLLGLAALGTGQVRRRWRGGEAPVLAAAGVLAATGYLVAVVPVLPGGDVLLRSVITAVPGLGLLRDGHRWLALPALAVAVLAGFGASALTRALSRARPALRGTVWATGPTAAGATVLVLAVSAVLTAQTSLAWGLGGRLDASHYPAGWGRARAVLDHAGDRDRVVVLPWQPFRVFAWTGAAPVLDPAPRILPRPVLVSDALTVDGRRSTAEGEGARAVTAALRDGDLDAAEARRLGIGWILLERGTPGQRPVLPVGARTVLDTPSLLLLRLEGAGPVPRAGTGRVVAVTGAHLLFGLSLLVAAAGLGRDKTRSRATGRDVRVSASG